MGFQPMAMPYITGDHVPAHDDDTPAPGDGAPDAVGGVLSPGKLSAFSRSMPRIVAQVFSPSQRQGARPACRYWPKACGWSRL